MSNEQEKTKYSVKIRDVVDSIPGLTLKKLSDEFNRDEIESVKVDKEEKKEIYKTHYVAFRQKLSRGIGLDEFEKLMEIINSKWLKERQKSHVEMVAEIKLPSMVVDGMKRAIYRSSKKS